MKMQLKDAAKILDLSGVVTKKKVKKAYRKAAAQYHPDKGGSIEMMQLVNAAYDTLKDFEGDLGETENGYATELNEALNKIIDLPEIEIEVCGSWIWVTGNTKPHRKILGKDGAGFYYASKKRAWYFRPDDWKSSSHGNWTLEDIREKHGSQSVNTRKQYHLN